MFKFKLKRTFKIIKRAIKLSEPNPLIVNFSGGKDSLVVLHLIRRLTDNFICIFCKSSLDFPQVIEAVETTAKDLDVELHFSTPDLYKGDFWKLLKIREKFPTINYRWCSRDLKNRRNR